jgi:hypothetical protein
MIFYARDYSTQIYKRIRIKKTNIYYLKKILPAKAGADIQVKLQKKYLIQN